MKIIPNYIYFSAPLEGITDDFFMEHLDKTGGVGIIFTRFLRVLKNGNCQPSLNSIDPKKYKTPIFLQLLGKEEEFMAEAAFQGEERGFSGIDINLGCPSATVTKKGCGSALLTSPEKIFNIIKKVKNSITIDLSVKIRSGYTDSNNFIENIMACEEAGADFITIHPRLQSELYSGIADWNFIKLAREKLKIPICGNGDIKTIKDAEEKKEFSKVEYLMIGRGSVSNPFIFRDLKENRIENRENFLKNIKHYYQKMVSFYVEKYGSQKMALIRLKQHISYLDIENSTKLKFLRSKSLNEIFQKIENFL